MSQFNLKKNSVNADQIYFDLTVTNFQNINTTPIPFYYNESRTLPFIDVPEDYYLSILRFTVETNTLPVFLPIIQPASQQGVAPTACDVDLTIYSVTLQYNDTISGLTKTCQSFIKYIPQNASLTPPVGLGANGIQINDGGYYNVYNFSWWTYLIWLAFQRAWDGEGGIYPTGYGTADVPLKTQLAGIGVVLTDVTEAPIITWDSTSNTNVINGQYGYCRNYIPIAPSVQTPVEIYMNPALYGIMSSFPSRYLGYENVTKGRNFLIELANIAGTNIQPLIYGNPNTVPAPTPIVTYALYQENSTTANWSPITAIVFVSNTLPINPNQVSTPLIFNNNEQIALGGTNADTANIITDLVSETGEYRPNLVYLPTAEYRFITLFGNRPLYNLDLSIFARLKTGQLVPFTLQSGGAVTVKFAFIKKTSVGDTARVTIA